LSKSKRPGHLAKYAAHAGISQEVAARQLKKAGVDYYKPFDFAAVDKRIAAGRHPARAKYAKRKFESVETPPFEPSPESEPESSAISFLEAQRRKELANAQLKELEVQKRAGELIEVATVEKAMFEKGRQVRDALQSLADRLAGILAPISDQAKVHEVMSKEIHQALEGLTGKSA
jgi:hypothetical protein